MKRTNLFLLILLNILLISCSSITSKEEFQIDDTTYRAQGKNHRIKYVILHYTATNDEIGIKTLTKEQVSSHYLVTSKDSDPIYNLVDEKDRAWHAGVSEFNGVGNINDTSIGIEITNRGINNVKGKNYGFFVPKNEYIEYKPVQIKKVAFLLNKIIEKYNIKPTNIIGHSDIAPTRKLDPGPLFPWKKLHTVYGLGAWYDENDKKLFMNEELFELTPVTKIKDEFRKYGYKINNTDEWDEESRRVVYSFQAHFLPNNLTGNMDLETYATLRALNKKYRGR